MSSTRELIRRPDPLTRRILWFHPEWVALAVAATGWLGLVAALTFDPGLALGTPKRHSATEVLAHSAGMTQAMMAPLVLGQVSRVAAFSLWERRYRSAAAYLVGYLGAWTALGAMLMVLGATLVASLGWPVAVLLTAGVAVAVSSTADHRRRLRRCQSTRPLALHGRRADVDCVREGVAMAGRCAATTVALMLMVSVQHGVAVMAAATALMLTERLLLVRPRALVAWTAALGVLASALTLISGG